jgi:hypothetical protein
VAEPEPRDIGIGGDGSYLDHEEDSDFWPVEDKADGVSATFNRHNVLDDAFFTALGPDAAAVQAFLENTPYNGRRSFLADETVSGRPVSEVLVEVAREHELNPILLLSRMQVEKSLVGKSSRPSQHSVDYAMGCGCPDNSGCSPAYRGLDKQLACAADVLRGKADESMAGTAQWRKGKTRSTLDGLSITPQSHATAALYAYTPWVLTGQGGNWLVWNITKKYAAAIDSTPRGFIGSACTENDAELCEFEAGGEQGSCHAFTDTQGQAAGICTIPCEGICPDGAGVITFCVELAQGQGSCVAKSRSSNSHCADIPGTHEVEMERFVGQGGASVTRSVVCVPNEQAEAEPEPEAPAGPSCEGRCDTSTPVPGSEDDPCYCDDICVQNQDCCADHDTVCGG